MRSLTIDVTSKHYSVLSGAALTRLVNMFPRLTSVRIQGVRNLGSETLLAALCRPLVTLSLEKCNLSTTAQWTLWQLFSGARLWPETLTTLCIENTLSVASIFARLRQTELYPILPPNVGSSSFTPTTACATHRSSS